MIAAAILVAGLAALSCLLPNQRIAWRMAWSLLTLSALFGLGAGVAGLTDRTGELQVLLGAPAAFSLSVDRLSGLFLVICFVPTIPLCLCGFGSARVKRRPLPALVAALVVAVLIVVSARNLFTLLFGWEGVTFAFYLLTNFDRQQPRSGPASLYAASFGKASGAALLIGGLLLTASSHSLELSSWSQVPQGAARDAGYVLLLIGFGIKTGLAPWQIWLPRSYAAASAPARALMAGVAVNVGFYGWWRNLEILGAPPAWLTTTMLVLGGITAIFGIAQAAVSTNLATLVAWSSVENAGVIATGFSMGLLGADIHQPKLMAAGLLAATAQVMAHALGKTLLFSATLAIEDDTGTLEIEDLRGVGRRLPAAGAGLVIGSLTLAGMPFTIGFASEWLTLQSLMQQFRATELEYQLGAVVAGSLVALSVGVAGLTFVRVVGFIAYGDEPPAVGASHTDRSPMFRIGLGALCLACLGVAAAAHWQIQLISVGLHQLVGAQVDAANAPDWAIQPVYSGFSALSPGKLWIVVPVLCGVLVMFTCAVSGRRLFAVRRTAAWGSGSPGADRRSGYTAFAFANPMRRILSTMLMSSDTTTPTAHRGAIAAEDVVGSLHRQARVIDVVERYAYLPVWALVQSVARAAQRLQSGRLDAYLAYMLIAVLAVISVITFWN